MAKVVYTICATWRPKCYKNAIGRKKFYEGGVETELASRLLKLLTNTGSPHDLLCYRNAEAMLATIHVCTIILLYC
jgi:hypothetical protein